MFHEIFRPLKARMFAGAIGSVLCVLALMGSATTAHAQGCVAAHSNQAPMDELCDSDTTRGVDGGAWIHRLTVNVGYRVFSSEYYFVGTQ